MLTIAPATSLLADTLRARRGLPPPPLRKALREAAGVSLAEIAAEVSERLPGDAGVTKQAVALWERGLRNPRPAHLRIYAEILRLLREAA